MSVTSKDPSTDGNVERNCTNPGSVLVCGMEMVRLGTDAEPKARPPAPTKFTFALADQIPCAEKGRALVKLTERTAETVKGVLKGNVN